MTPHIQRLPILIVSAHSRCNCRCAMCDIWKGTETERFTEADLEKHLPDIRALGVEWIVFTGGEPLMNPDLFRIAARLRAVGIRVTLLSSGLLLARYAPEIAAHIDDVIVSLDGPPAIHDRIRGVIGAFDQLASGLRRLRNIAPGYPVAARCTVQRANFRALTDAARTAQSLQLGSISYLAVDISSAAFAHPPGVLRNALLPAQQEIDELACEIARLTADPVFSIVAENPAKLARMVAYFSAMVAGREPDAPRCNAPWVSAVLHHDGSVSPCFFHPSIGSTRETSLEGVLNSDAAIGFRERLDVAANPICRRCVCSLYRPEFACA